MAKFATNKVTPVTDSIAWVRRASGNVLWQGITKEELHNLVVECLVSYAAFKDMTIICWYSSSYNACDHHHPAAGLRWNGFVALLTAPPRLSYFLTSTPPSQPDNTYFQVTDTKKIIWPQIEKYLLTLCIFCLQPHPSFLHSQTFSKRMPFHSTLPLKRVCDKSYDCGNAVSPLTIFLWKGPQNDHKILEDLIRGSGCVIRFCMLAEYTTILGPRILWAFSSKSQEFERPLLRGWSCIIRLYLPAG